MQRTLARAGTGVLCAIALLALPPAAQAAHNRGQAEMLVQADVPSPLGKPTGYTFTNRKLDRTLAPCVGADGRDIAPQLAPRTQFQAAVTTARLGYTEVTEQVYQYPSRSAAAAAFAALQSGAVQCTGETTATDGSGGSIRTALSTGAAPVGSFTNLWVQEVSRYSASDGTAATVQYAVFTQAGKAIIKTSLYQNDGRLLSAGQRNALAGLALTLAERWTADEAHSR